MSTIHCDAELFTIGSWTILRLPKSASAQLPSRSMTVVKGTINGARFHEALEPDGKGSHWFRVDDTLREAAGADADDTVTLEIEPTKDWPGWTCTRSPARVLSGGPPMISSCCSHNRTL